MARFSERRLRSYAGSSKGRNEDRVCPGVPRAVLRRMLVARPRGIHYTPNDHHPRLPSRTMAHRFLRVCRLQRSLLDTSIRAPVAVANYMYAVRCKVLGPLLRCANRTARVGLVLIRLVLYSFFSASGSAVSLQHGRFRGQ